MGALVTHSWTVTHDQVDIDDDDFHSFVSFCSQVFVVHIFVTACFEDFINLGEHVFYYLLC